MYSTGGSGAKKQRPTTGYLVRPKLGPLRSLYSNRPLSALSNEKRKRTKKSAPPQKMDFRRKPDYADTAYREAVGRLRILMAESYTPIRRIYGNRPIRELDSAGEETDNQSMISAGSRNSRIPRSFYNYNPITPRKYYYPPLKSNLNTEKPQEQTSSGAPPELMSFIERQEDYIEQLEKESRFCRDELSSLLSKVKEVISENEHLHEKQKSKLIKSVFDHLDTETETETEPKARKSRLIEGPSIVFESRISELEAQLTQARIDLKKSLEDNDSFRQKLSDGNYLEGNTYENFKRQLDGCHREKDELLTKVKSLQTALAALRDKESDTCDQVKRSLDVADQAQYEKKAAELEVRRLKDELERQHMKLRDAIADQSRRISDERSAVERRYTQQIEQLTAEVGVQWETTNKLQLELDKQRRDNADLRRECAQKQALIDELKKDTQSKILTLQSDIGATGAEKSALEQQISTLNMVNERTERQYKQEITRLQAEIQSLRQRMDRADADLIHSRRENIRLNEQVAALEKEINLSTALSEERAKSVTPRAGEVMALPPPTPKDGRELSSMIQDMENKHAATVTELENMIHSQNQLMDKLSSECHTLTRKLEDSSHKHKEEIRELQTSLDRLSNRFSQAQYPTTDLKDEEHPQISNQRISPPSQAAPTSAIRPPEPAPIGRSDSRTSLKLKSRPTSRQTSQEKLAQDPQPYNTQQQYDAPQTEYTNQQYNMNQPQYDPTRQYLAEGEGHQYQYDPNAQYDPQYEGDQVQYDPNQQYDPNRAYSEEYAQDQYYADQTYNDSNLMPEDASYAVADTNSSTDAVNHPDEASKS